tara:strand:- start:2123 stop:3178 length:1056 start_codon:yes stop_codon:yes gene_type:complete
MGYMPLDDQIYVSIDQQIDALTQYPAFKKLEGKKSAFKKKYLALAKKRIREITGKKRIRSDTDLRNLEYNHGYDTEDTLRPFFVYMTKLLHKHVFGKAPTPAEMQSYKSHKIVHDVHGHWVGEMTHRENSDGFGMGFTLLPRAFDKIRVTNPKLFKKKIAVWEKKALNNLPSDAITFENFKSGDKAIHLGYGRYISLNTFRRLEKKSKTAEQVYETYRDTPAWDTTSQKTMNMTDPYTRKALKRKNVEFVTLYKKPAPKKSSPSPKKIAAATKIQARVRGIRNRKYVKNLKKMITVAAAARKARERAAARAAAATKIQARARGIRNRKKVASLKKNNQRTKILKALQARGL